MTLSDLYNKKLDDDEDGEDFVEDGEEEDDDDDIDDEDEPATKKAKVGNDNGTAEQNWKRRSKKIFKIISKPIANFTKQNFIYEKHEPVFLFSL